MAAADPVDTAGEAEAPGDSAAVVEDILVEGDNHVVGAAGTVEVADSVAGIEAARASAVVAGR